MFVKKLINTALAAGRTFLSDYDAYRICEEFNIPCPLWEFSSTKSECLAAAEKIGYPVALKIVCAEATHKSDVGGVVVDIRSEEEVAAAYNKVVNSTREKTDNGLISGVIVQKSMPKGVEAVVGGLKNDQFGPVVMFGTGGTLVEIVKDVSFRLAPLDKAEAYRQITETKVFEILKGVRGAPACDIDALTEIIVNTGTLLSEIPEIQQIDLNPVLAYPSGCSAVDIRIGLNGTRYE